MALTPTELDLPPFDWPTSAKQIEAATALVIEAATANLASVAAVPDDEVSFGASDRLPEPWSLSNLHPRSRTPSHICAESSVVMMIRSIT